MNTLLKNTKTPLLALLLCCSLTAWMTNPAKAQWTAQTSGTTQELLSVTFTDTNTGYAVGRNGIILKTTNAGTTWTAQTSGTTQILRSITFTDVNTGYAVGDGGTILKTTNAGTNWTAQTSGITQSLLSISFTNVNTGYAVGDGGAILKTTNAGTNWTELTIGVVAIFRSATFTDTNIGYVVGNDGRILKTTNAGTTWTAQTSGTTQSLLSVSFPDANTGYAVGWSGTILKTTNGGTAWTAQTSGTTNVLYSITFTDANTGYAVGSNGTILKTTNAGANWITLTSGTTQLLRAVNFADSNTGYAVGSNGTILKYVATPEINLKQNTTNIASGGSYNFGNTNVNASSTDVTFTIENTGSADLTLSGTAGNLVVLGGTDANQFSVTQTNVTSPIAANSNKTFTVKFSPTSAGTKNATLTITSNDADEGTYTINLQGTGTKANQTITFNALSNKAFGDAPFNLSATASSGLTVSYASSNTAVATVSGNTVTIVGVGTTNITASQAGNTDYNAATDVVQAFTVTKANQTITFNALPNKAIGDAPFNLSATASSGLTVSYASSNTAVATVSGNTVTIVGVGTTNITASQAGNATYNAATNVVQAFTVTKANQAITFNALPIKILGDAPFNLSATASSGLTVSYASSNTAVATVSGNTVTIVGIGTANITASQAGNATYNAATDVVQSLIVNDPAKTNQTITFNALPNKAIGDAPFNLSATASSGLTVSYASSNTAVATVSGNTVTIVGVGTTNITASQAGNATYNTAPPVIQALTVTKANQTITFNALSSKNVGDAPFTLSATVSSNLAVSYASSNTAVATVSGNTVTIVGAGTTNITASQAGNATYNAATDVVQTLTVLLITAIEDNLAAEGALLYPNPIIGNTFSIRWENAQTLQGVLFNSLGVQVATINAEKDAKDLFQCTLPNTLPTGQYFLRVQNEKGEERSFKIVK